MAAVEKTYGDALFSLFLEEDSDALENALDSMKKLSEIFAAEPDFIKLIKAPTVSGEEKEAMIREIFGGRLHRFVLNFLLVLAGAGRIDSFDGILKRFTELYNDYKNIADVTVVSAMPLSDGMTEKIRAKMAEVTGKTVNMTVKTDPEVIGGIVISCGNTTIDGSVKARLERLRRDIASTIA